VIPIGYVIGLFMSGDNENDYSKSNMLIRVAKFGKIYKLLKLFRLVKIFKILKNKEKMSAQF
jgi:hypothetical protein